MSVAWEVYCDLSYFDMWAVRPVGDKDFNSPRLFHFASESDAHAFAELASKASVATKRFAQLSKEPT